MEKTKFGVTKEGNDVTKYTLQNEKGMRLSVIDLGATVVSLQMEGSDGVCYDVVLGYDSPAEYQTHTCYFGAIIGRNANRIGGAKIALDGINYDLEQNDNENNLHSGSRGFHAVIWNIEKAGEDSITFSYVSKDREQDFPGNMTVKVTYALTEQNEVVIEYEAVSDQTTVANLTNHCYFNLDGHNSGSVKEQQLLIKASAYTPVVDAKAIPTGEIADVTDTPMDFRSMKKIGAQIEEDFAQLKHVGGYDHNFCIDGACGSMQPAACAKGAKSGIVMEVYTDCPGIQFYAGNFIGKQTGKGGANYGDRHGFCLETQYYPNAVNEQNFASPLLKPGETYRTTTKYCFSCER